MILCIYIIAPNIVKITNKEAYMKNIKILAAALFLPLVLNLIPNISQAGTHLERVQVVELVCGEFDPFVIGDACLVFIEHNQQKYGVYFPDHELHNALEDINWSGDYQQLFDRLQQGEVYMNVPKELLSQLSNPEQIEVLKQFDASSSYVQYAGDVHDFARSFLASISE